MYSSLLWTIHFTKHAVGHQVIQSRPHFRWGIRCILFEWQSGTLTKVAGVDERLRFEKLWISLRVWYTGKEQANCVNLTWSQITAFRVTHFALFCIREGCNVTKLRQLAESQTAGASRLTNQIAAGGDYQRLPNCLMKRLFASDEFSLAVWRRKHHFSFFNL